MKLFLSSKLSLCSFLSPPASDDRLGRDGGKSEQTEEQMRGEEVEGGKLLPSSSVHECLKHLLHLPWVASSHAESISFRLLLALTHPSLRCLFHGSDVEGRVCLLKWQ